MKNARLQVSIVICLALLVTACAAMRHRDTVRAGILKTGTTQQAFLDVGGHRIPLEPWFLILRKSDLNLAALVVSTVAPTRLMKYGSTNSAKSH